MMSNVPPVRTALLTAVLLPVLSCSSEPVVSEFFGQLEPGLTAPDSPSFYERLRPLEKRDKSADGLNLSKQANVFSGRWRIAPAMEQTVLLVEEGGQHFVATDANRDGALTDDERFPFQPILDDEYFTSEAVIEIATNSPTFAVFPIRVREPVVEGMPGDGSLRFLWRTVVASAWGSIDLAGRPLRVRFDSFHPVSGKLDPRRGGQGIDGNGDGEIAADARSAEWAHADDETVIFRAGEEYLSTKELDLENGRIVMTRHSPSEYQRVELVIGQTVPDFEFVDFDGNKRSLAEFRGRPVLLSFWGAWCGPCIAEIPYLKQAYSQFQPEGLEILGLDFDPASHTPTPELLAKGLDRARTLVAEQALAWPQARTESILDLIVTRFRISAFPTKVLLDSEGKILSAGAPGHPPLRKEGLLETLETLLSGAQAASR